MLPGKDLSLLGAAAYREFELVVDHGSMSFACTLGQNDIDSLAARVARNLGAVSYGLVSASEGAGEEPYQMAWFYNGVDLVIVPADPDRVPSTELTAVVADLLPVFFSTIAGVSREAAALNFTFARRESGGTVQH
jgi:hypothetical protein